MRKLIPILILALTAVGAGAAWAGPVHVQVNRGSAQEFGAGYSVGKESECFIVAPLHVVDGAAPGDITITDSEGRRAAAELIKGILDFDAALLKVSGTVAIDCPEDWEDGSATAAAVGDAPFLVSKKVDSNGRTEQNRLFVSGLSKEMIDLEPYDPNNALREGDSGSSLYAGNQLVGMIVSVDTATGAIVAVTQNQIHGLFGTDVLPQEQAKALLQPFIYQRREEPYATIAAREYLTKRTPLAIIEAPAQTTARASQPPPIPDGVDYVVTGNILDITTQREKNPNYKPPSKEKLSFGDALLKSVVKSTTGVDEDTQYYRIYNIDIEIDVQDLARMERARNLERRSLKLPESGQNARDMQKSAVQAAVIQALELTFVKYGLPRTVSE